MLALGYAGWGPGQLDTEMQQNAWLSAPADPPWCSTTTTKPSGAARWRVLHIDPLLLSDVAGHA